MTFHGRCRLRQLLTKRGMTQTELAERVGLSPKQISDYVNNRRVMSLRNAHLIARVLRCSMDDLYEWSSSE